MDEQVFLARRATLDDLPVLRELWLAEQFDADALEKRVTEFQVAYDAQGVIVGAIGMRREAEQGMLHSESFADFGVADRLRGIIWERHKTVAKNYALARVWMCDAGLYWKELGFDEVDEQTLEQLPKIFGAADQKWFSIMLRHDPFADGSAAAKHQELLFRQALKDETKNTLKQAQMIKMIALGISIILFIAICIAGLALYKYQQKMGLRSPMGQR